MMRKCDFNSAIPVKTRYCSRVGYRNGVSITGLNPFHSNRTSPFFYWSELNWYGDPNWCGGLVVRPVKSDKDVFFRVVLDSETFMYRCCYGIDF